jgi:hypothetical protein
VIRQVTEKMRGQDDLTGRQEDERTGVGVLVMRQLTVKMIGQYELTERKEDERSGVSAWVIVRMSC